MIGPVPASWNGWRALAPAVLAVALLMGGCAPAYDIEVLFRDLQSSDPDVRLEANETVDTLVREGNYAVFLRGLNSPNVNYRAESIIYVARMTRPEARRALLDLLRVEKRMMLPYNPIRMKPSSELRDSRILVAHLIATGGKDAGAVASLLQGLDREQPDEVVIGTCFALGALEDPAGVAYLVKASRSSSIEVVRAAVQSLARLQGADALAALHDLAGHPAFEVRSDVVSALSLRTDNAALDLLEKMGASDPSSDVRAAAIRGLMQTGTPALAPYLIERLRTGDEQTRAAAVDVLQKVTGRALGARADAWSRWWSENQARLAPSR